MAFTKEFNHLKIEMNDIVSATNNFDDDKLIGRGGFGKVYKGQLSLPEGQIMVAFKRLHRHMGQGNTEFWKEIMMLSKYKHENLVSLMHFCSDGKERILVYEYASRGSLDSYLSDASVTWTQRLKICLGAARGLNFLHDPTDTYQRVIHRDIKSANILLDDNWTAKVSDFGPTNQQQSYLVSNAAGKHGYCDPLYIKMGLLSKESDVYSFGVVMFEVMCGTLCYKLDKNGNLNILVPTWRKCYEEDKLDEIIFSGLQEQMEPGSLKLFSAMAYRCVKKSREERPEMDEIIKELELALKQQIGKLYAEFQIPLHQIETATSNFAAENLIKEDSFGKDYKGQMLRSGQVTEIVARRLDCIYGQEVKFFGAISIHSSLQHKNIISFIGFCNENGEKIIIYEHAAHGSLDRHLTDATLTWYRRLQICIGVARALSHVHYDFIHCDINSSKIFLDKDWEAKLSGFELSTKYPETWRHHLLFSHHFDISGNIDPVYLENATVTPKYDVYSFGVVLFEVICGRKAMIGNGGVDQSLAEMAKRHFEDRKLDDIIVDGLRKQMDLESLTIFSNTAYNCLKERVQRPNMDQVVRDLEEALEHQWKHDNIKQSAAADEDLSSNRLKSKFLECLRINFIDIKLATDNFNQKHCKGSTQSTGQDKRSSHQTHAVTTNNPTAHLTRKSKHSLLYKVMRNCDPM